MTPSAIANAAPLLLATYGNSTPDDSYLRPDTASNGAVWCPVLPPFAPAVRSLPTCRRCGNRTVAREYQDCNVCKGRRR